jgi:hypothetical protein
VSESTVETVEKVKRPAGTFRYEMQVLGDGRRRGVRSGQPRRVLPELQRAPIGDFWWGPRGGDLWRKVPGVGRVLAFRNGRRPIRANCTRSRP